MNTKFTQVLLAPTLDRTWEYNNLEPQYVRVKSNNLANVYLDSQVIKNQSDATNIYVNSSNRSDQIAHTLIYNVSRVCINAFSMFWIPITISPYNKTISFFVGLTKYSFDLVVGFHYTTSTALATDIVTGMNTAYGSANFSASPTFNDAFSFVSAGPLFQFDPTCSMAQKGKTVVGLPIVNNPLDQRGAWTVGPMRLIYSEYVDVICNELTQYTKNPSLSVNKIGYNIAYRQSLNNPVNNVYSSFKEDPAWQDWDFAANAVGLTFMLYDANGDPFYYWAGGAEGIQSTLNWHAQLFTQV